MTATERYLRQNQVQQIGAAGQRKLKAARVAVIGVGGLGCQVATQLVGAGVGQLCLVDHDRVELSNLHRQFLFREQDIGQAKVAVAKRELQARNTEINIDVVHARFGPMLANKLLTDFDLVIDAADNMAASYLASDICFPQRVPLLTASVNRTFGYLGAFCGNTKQAVPSLRAVFPTLPRSQLSCETTGVTGPSVGIIGSYQAQEALKILLGDEHCLLGSLLYLDLWNYSQHRVDFSYAQEPIEQQIALIGADELQQSDFVIDVRNVEEIAQQAQPFATSKNIPLEQISSADIPLNGKSRIVLACRSGQRALSGAQQLINAGHVNVAVVLPD